MNLVLGEFAKKVEGASEAYANSAEGIRKQNELIIANAKENIGEKLLPIYAGFLTGLNELLEGKFKNVFERFQGRGALVDAMNAYRNNVNKLVDETLQDIDKTEKALYGAQRLGANASVINALKRKLEDLRALKQDTEKLSKGVDGDEETEKKKVQTTKKTAEQKKKVEEEYYNDVTNLDKEYQKMLDDASKQSIERVQNANEKKYENNKKYKQMELDLIKENLDAELPDDVAEQKEKSRLAREELYNQVLNTANTAQEVINIEQQKTDRLIALQEERVNSARENSAVSLKIEQERLDALLEKRRKYERAQRIIDAGVIVANQAVAI
jgi:flagellar biosynthesis GTPase FlhF